ncbi:MAG: hypothetical protein M0P95_07825 [Sulfuritalea sp.]|nr:hypothetical protein [Sulfuritalea sp.]
MNHSQPELACALPETHAVVRQIISVLGFDVVSSPDYASRLVPALNAAVEYLDGQIASIPGPYDISAAHYAHSPLVNALFPARQEIAHGLGRSREVKQPLAFLAGAEQKQAFALLGARRWANPEHAGEAPAFCDHTLRSLAANEFGARQGLRTAAMTRLVTEFGEHVDKLRQKGSLPRAEWNMENAGSHQPADADKGKLVLAKEELQPANLLRGLIAWLQRPSEYLQVRAAKNGNDGGSDPVDALSQLLSRDRRCWTACIVCFPTAEGIAAVENEAHPHRYIVI